MGLRLVRRYGLRTAGAGSGVTPRALPGWRMARRRALLPPALCSSRTRLAQEAEHVHRLSRRELVALGVLVADEVRTGGRRAGPHPRVQARQNSHHGFEHHGLQGPSHGLRGRWTRIPTAYRSRPTAYRGRLKHNVQLKREPKTTRQSVRDAALSGERSHSGPRMRAFCLPAGASREIRYQAALA